MSFGLSRELVNLTFRASTFASSKPSVIIRGCNPSEIYRSACFNNSPTNMTSPKSKSRANTPAPEDNPDTDSTSPQGKSRAKTPSPNGDSQAESQVDSPPSEDKPQDDSPPPEDSEADANYDQECGWECHICHHRNPEGQNQCHGSKVCGHIYCDDCRDSIHPRTRVPVIWCCQCNTAIDAKRGDKCTFKRGRWCGHPLCSACLLYDYYLEDE